MSRYVKNEKQGEYSGSIKYHEHNTNVAGNAAEFVVVKNQSNKIGLELLSCYVILVTDGTASDRYVTLNAYNKAGFKMAEIQVGSLTASKTWEVGFYKDAVDILSMGSNNLIKSAPLPVPFLYPFEELRISIDGGVAGDTYQFTAAYRVVRVVTNV